MYSNEDFERLFIRYKGETYPPRAKASRRAVTETMSPTIYSRNGTRIQVS